MDEVQQRGAPAASERAALSSLGAPLATAAIATLLASSCCVVPLVMASVGLTGAWLGRLRVIEPYSPILIGVSIAALTFAGRSLINDRRNASCPALGNKTRTVYKATFWLLATLTLLLLVTPVVAPWFY
jgi:mercuric ion transport protein